MAATRGPKGPKAKKKGQSPIIHTSLSQEDRMISSTNSPQIPFPKEMTIVFVRFYPEFEKEDEYSDLKASATKKGKIEFNGFKWHFDESPIHQINFNKYTEEVNELENILNAHIKGLVTSIYNNIKKVEGESAQVVLEIEELSGRELHRKMQKLSSTYKTRGNDNNNNNVYKIRLVISSLPKTHEQLLQARELFKNLKLTDQVYISTHGNPDVTGQGPFALTPKEIAINLFNLGVAKDFVPFLALWSCRSAIIGKNNKKSLTENLFDELTKLGYKHLEIVGTRGLLYGGFNALVHHTYVTQSKKSKTKLPPERAIQFYSTPNSKPASVIRSGGIYTNTFRKALGRSRYTDVTNVTRTLFTAPNEKTIKNENNNNNNNNLPPRTSTTSKKQSTRSLPPTVAFRYTRSQAKKTKTVVPGSKKPPKTVESDYFTRSKSSSKVASTNPTTPTKKT